MGGLGGMVSRLPNAGSTLQGSATPKRQAIRQHKRVAIVRAATKVFLERGFHGASMDLIAHATGITKPTLYKYFNSKEDLFRAIIEDSAQRVALGCERLKPGEGCYSALLGLGHAYAEIISEPETAGIMQLVRALGYEKPDLARYYHSLVYEIVTTAFIGAMEAQVERGYLVFDDPKLAIDHFRALVVTPYFTALTFDVSEHLKKVRRDQYIERGVKAFIKIYGTALTAQEV